MPHPADNPNHTLRYLVRKVAQAERDHQTLRDELEVARKSAQAASEYKRQAEKNLRKFVEDADAEATAALDTEAKA